jgi:hypothetical protein
MALAQVDIASPGDERDHAKVDWYDVAELALVVMPPGY